MARVHSPRLRGLYLAAVIGLAMSGTLALVAYAWPARAGSYDPGFQVRAGSSEWYLEIAAEADTVELVIAGGTPVRLSATSWGTFTRGGHLARGTSLELIARRGSETARTAPFSWLNQPPVLLGADTPGGTSGYDPGFVIRGSSSAWWLEVAAEADAVEVIFTNGTRQTLSATSWGTFTRGGSLPRGTMIRLAARLGAARAETAPFAYLVQQPVLSTSSSSSGGGDTSTSSFAATFSDVRGTSWWIQLQVQAAVPIQAVEVRPGSSAWAPMDRQSWGHARATSIYVPYGTLLQFRARSGTGALAYSGTYRWPDAVLVSSGDTRTVDSGGDTGTSSSATYGTHSPITSAVLANMRAIAGNAPGRNNRVFAKVGDSISVGWGFMACFAQDPISLDGRTWLQPSIDWFRAGRAAGTTPFNRESEATNPGWTAYLTLNRGVVQTEIAAINPRFAVVMLGTNDAGYRSTSEYTADMNGLVDLLISLGVIPILSTIPPIDAVNRSAPEVPNLNRAIRDLAARRNLPLVDLNATLARMPDHGLRDDGVHLSTDWNRYLVGSCDFRPAGLRYGTAVRNLVTMEALHRVRTAFVENRTIP